MIEKIIGPLLAISGIVFGFLETIYFSNNWLPNSKEEAVCDVVSFIMYGCGTIIFLKSTKIKVK